MMGKEDFSLLEEGSDASLRGPEAESICKVPGSSSGQMTWLQKWEGFQTNRERGSVAGPREHCHGTLRLPSFTVGGNQRIVSEISKME